MWLKEISASLFRRGFFSFRNTFLRSVCLVPENRLSVVNFSPALQFDENEECDHLNVIFFHSLTSGFFCAIISSNIFCCTFNAQLNYT